MRIHTDHLTNSDVYAAARLARVDLHRFTEHGSKSRARAFDVLLTGESRRRPNAGTSTWDRREGEFAATWDQWGVFLAALFEADENMFTPYDESAVHFAARTGDRFGAPEDEVGQYGYVRRFRSYGWPADAHGDHAFRFDGTPCEQVCKTKGVTCSAVQRWGSRAADFMPSLTYLTY